MAYRKSYRSGARRSTTRSYRGGGGKGRSTAGRARASVPRGRSAGQTVKLVIQHVMPQPQSALETLMTKKPAPAPKKAKF